MFCVILTWDSIPIPFVGEQFTATTTEEFNELAEDAIVNNAASFEDLAEDTATDLYTPGQSIFKPGNALFYLPRKGLFGNCNWKRPVYFG